jgi:hypothetical protein
MLDRGEVDAAQIEEVEAICRTTSDPDAKATPDAVQGQLAATTGRLVEAYDAYLRAADLASGSRWGQLTEAGYVALWIGDPDRVHRVLARLKAEPDAGQLVEAIQGLSSSGLDALQGRVTEARAGFRSALDGLGEGTWWQARAQMTAAMLLPSAPEAPAWADAARVVFERCRARPYLAMLDRVVASWASAGADGGARTPSHASSEGIATPAQQSARRDGHPGTAEDRRLA